MNTNNLDFSKRRGLFCPICYRLHYETNDLEGPLLIMPPPLWYTLLNVKFVNRGVVLMKTVVVVGGGITGLSTMYYLQKQLKRGVSPYD